MAKDIAGKYSFSDVFSKEAKGFFVKLNNRADTDVIKARGQMPIVVNIQGTHQRGNEYSTTTVLGKDYEIIVYFTEDVARRTAVKINTDAEELRKSHPGEVYEKI